MKKIYHLFYYHSWYCFNFLLILIGCLIFNLSVFGQQGQIILTDQTQKDFLKAYKSVFDLSDQDYRGTSTTMDKVMFPQYGEF
ncbi:MAG TPA: hypothetical protein VIH57_01740, partial [Bacteroidales bacterium]